MNEVVLTLVKGDKTSSTTDYSDALPVNCSAVIRPILGVQGYMLEQPGITQYATGFGTDWGGFYSENFGILYRVSGSKLISVTTTGTVVDLGSMAGSITNKAHFAASIKTIAIVAGGKYSLYDPTLGLRNVTDTDVGAPIDICWIDGMYVMTDGQYLYHTDILDESSVNALKYGAADFSPDSIRGVGITSDNKLIAFGRYSIEFFYNAANSQFAFTRIPARNVAVGIIGVSAKASLAEDWYFVGGPAEGDISVYKLGVGTAQRIASREVDKILGGFTEFQLDTAILEVRVIDGYRYLVLFISGNKTLLCNVTVGEQFGFEYAWSIIKSTSTSGDAVYRGINAVFNIRQKVWVCGDSASTALGFLDTSVSTHFGNAVEHVLYTPFTDLKNRSISEIEAQTIPGHTTASDATVFLSLSYDGQTYTTEVSLDYGGPAQYGQKFIARRCGAVRDWFSLKLRWVASSRMAFSKITLRHK
jgi:hypothetical protein